MTTTNESQYPSVESAYDFVLPSYAWVQNRMDAVDQRIESLLAFLATVTLGVPIFIVSTTDTSQVPNFLSPYFIAAVVLFVASSGLGFLARLIGGVMVMDPNRLYEAYLHLSTWEFKKDILFFAGEHFTKNRSLIAKKHRLANLMVVLFATEGLFWFLWLLSFR